MIAGGVTTGVHNARPRSSRAAPHRAVWAGSHSTDSGRRPVTATMSSRA